jgi:ParB family chromosome partitioning protein
MSTITSLPIASVHANPDQPRKAFAVEALEELADSIRTYGLLEPIIVRPVEGPHHGTFEIIAGERRWRASGMAGLTMVPAIVREETDAVAFELSMVENVVRADMNPVEEAEGYQRLLDSGMDLDTMAARLGKKRGTIENRLRLVQLADSIRDLVRRGQMDAYDGALVAGLSHEGQYRVLRALTAGQLTHQGDLARLVSAIRLEESQVGAFPETPDETSAAVRTATAASVLDHLAAAAASLEKAGEAIGGAGDLETLGAVADSIKKQAARIAAAVHAQRAAQIAKGTR